MTVEQTIDNLEEKLKDSTLDFLEKIDIKDQILKLKYSSGLKDKPKDSYFSCVGCSG